MTELDQTIVVRFRDGRTERCECHLTVDAEREIARVERAGQQIDEIPFSQLKAIFFLRNPDAALASWESLPGISLAVEFADGEIVRGKSDEYNPARKGFYLCPEDRTRSDKIFVVTASVVSVDVESY